MTFKYITFLLLMTRHEHLPHDSPVPSEQFDEVRASDADWESQILLLEDDEISALSHTQQ